jgi:hypothetical protein
MQRVQIYNDLLHLTGEWLNADMLNRGTENRLSLSLSLSLFSGVGERPLRPPLDLPLPFGML